MSKADRFRQIGSKKEPPAAQRAWNALHPNGRVPTAVEVLTHVAGRRTSRKSEIYRLVGAGVGSTNVIAKRSAGTRIQRERQLYESVLPRLSVRSLGYYGWIASEGDERAWLFLEEATGATYDETDEHHRLAASRWLAQFHTGTAGNHEFAAVLPHLQLQHYEDELRQCAALAQFARETCQWGHAAGNTFTEVLRHCDGLRRAWGSIEQRFQSSLPASVAHCDFIGKNVCIAMRTSSDPEVLVMDWDEARYGVAIEDLAGLEPRVYWENVASHWDLVDLATLIRAEATGRVLRSLAWIRTTLKWLGPEWRDAGIRDLEGHVRRLSLARADAKL